METRETHAGKAEAQLKQWGVKIDELVTKAQAVGTEAKFDYRERIDDLKAKYQVAKAKLGEAQVAGNEKWEAFKADFESAWGELEDAFKKLTS